MLIWLIFAVLTAVVMVVLLTPFYRSEKGERSRSAYDREVYRDQLTELEGDVERGLLGVEEAEGARIEIARRLLGAKDNSAGRDASQSSLDGSLTFRNLTFWSTSLAVPILALGGYLYLGKADAPGQPHATRFDKPLEQQKISILVGRVEERLRVRPNDGRGWEVIAPVYMRQGRYSDAANAYQRGDEAAWRKTGIAEGICRGTYIE